MPTYSTPRRGEVWRVSLDPTVGHEVKKTRPAVVVTNDIYNSHNWVVLVVPVTSHDRAEYDQVMIRAPEGGLSNNSVTLPDQLRAVDRTRLVETLGDLAPATVELIDRSLRIVLAL
jgi:mRNA interferase MazF